jgi:hypothetical protein
VSFFRFGGLSNAQVFIAVSVSSDSPRLL